MINLRKLNYLGWCLIIYFVCCLKKRKWNEMKNELKKESEMNWKRKTKETKIYKAFEWYWVVGHLVVGRFKSKKNDKWKRKEKRERRRGSGVAEALGCKGE